MANVRHRSTEIRQFILEHITEHPRDIVQLTAETFGISRQGVHRHIQSLVRQNILSVEGTTRSRRYELRPLAEFSNWYSLKTPLREDVVWRSDIRPVLRGLPENAIDIWQYGFTEILNNAIEHSAGETVLVTVTQTALSTHILILDDGVGIFKKLQRELGLENEGDALLELAKGKVTTDPAHHTGEGIFFTSRMFDDFFIVSGNVIFAHKWHEVEDEKKASDLIFEGDISHKGTLVTMDLTNTVSWTPKDVFDQFTTEGDFGFTKTLVPVRLARYGDEKLVSRSQARRLLAGIDRFATVTLDFEGVDMIGQAFADEVFRVFVAEHPQVQLLVTRVRTPVEHMIRWAAGPRAQAILGNEG